MMNEEELKRIEETCTKGGYVASDIMPLVDSCKVLIAEVRRLHSWEGLMSLLDEHWPEDIIDGSSEDVGPKLVAALRKINVLEKETSHFKNKYLHIKAALKDIDTWTDEVLQ